MSIRKKTCIVLGCAMFFSFFLIGVSGVYGDYESLFRGPDTGTGILENRLFSDTKEDVRVFARDIIFVVFGFLGTLMITFILYAGFLWTTAGGDEEKIKKAQHHLRDAIIGAVLVMSAWTISIFVLDALKFTVKEGGELDTLESQLAPSVYSVDDICFTACSGQDTLCISVCRDRCKDAKYLSSCECHEGVLGHDRTMECTGKKDP